METAKTLRARYKTEKRSARKAYRAKKREIKENYGERLSEYRGAEISASDPPRRSVLEETGNAITHGAGALLSVAAFVLMLVASDTREKTFSAIVYFIGLFFAFGFSCLYHSFRHGSKVKRLFRRFDYSSIYLLIGATYTPILLCFLGGVYGKVFCAVQWAVIITGVTFVGVFGPAKLRPLHFTLYIILGWSALLFLPKMISGNFPLFLFVLSGGVIYSLGIIPFAMNKKVSHFLWHFFVLFGAVLQWIGVYFYIYLA
ncbi:MAG: hemolysin III family protein [Clostridia bacterium]|nr:hemolysin III family protein [Clostridia bacterium]